MNGRVIGFIKGHEVVEIPVDNSIIAMDDERNPRHIYIIYGFRSMEQWDDKTQEQLDELIQKAKHER